MKENYLKKPHVNTKLCAQREIFVLLDFSFSRKQLYEQKKDLLPFHSTLYFFFRNQTTTNVSNVSKVFLVSNHTKLFMTPNALMISEKKTNLSSFLNKIRIRNLMLCNLWKYFLTHVAIVNLAIPHRPCSSKYNR